MIFRRKNTTNQTDSYLVYQYRRTRDGRYFGELFNRYGHLVFGLCMKYLKDSEKSSDATQQIFEKLLKELLQTEIKSFKSWLYMVAKNYCLMQLRKKDPLPLSGETYVQEPEIEDARLTEEHFEGLEQALEQLPADQQTCIRLFYLEDKSNKEISVQTEFEINQVKSHIQNGKRNLKNLLLKYESFKSHS